MEHEALPNEYAFFSRPSKSAFERYAIVDDSGVLFMSPNRLEIMQNWRLLISSNPYDIPIVGSAVLVHINPGMNTVSRLAL